MYKKPVILSCAAIALTAGSGLARARANYELAAFQTGVVNFTTLDTNNDGRISRAEFLSKEGSSVQEFSLINTNHDNTLSQREITAYNDIGDGPYEDTVKPGNQTRATQQPVIQ